MKNCYRKIFLGFGAAALLLASAVTNVRAQEAVSLEITIKNHRFEPAELRAPKGKAIKLTVKNADPTPEEFESKVLRVEKVIAGNSEAVFNLKPQQPGRYKFFGEFHEKTAQGYLVVE